MNATGETAAEIITPEAPIFLLGVCLCELPAGLKSRKRNIAWVSRGMYCSVHRPRDCPKAVDLIRAA